MAPGGTRRDELSRTLRRIPATSARQQAPRPRALRGSDAGLAAAAFVRALGESVRGAAAARRPGLGGDGGAGGRGGPLGGLKSELELTVDGADEVDPQLSLNKGYGGRPCERDRHGGREILGLKSGLRTDDGRPFVTDNWNVIIDLRIGLIADGPAVERSIRSIPGVVDTGSF